MSLVSFQFVLKNNLLKLDKILDLLAVFKVKIFNISNLFHTKDFQENI